MVVISPGLNVSDFPSLPKPPLMFILIWFYLNKRVGEGWGRGTVSHPLHPRPRIALHRFWAVVTWSKRGRLLLEHLFYYKLWKIFILLVKNKNFQNSLILYLLLNNVHKGSLASSTNMNLCMGKSESKCGSCFKRICSTVYFGNLCTSVPPF